MEPYSSLAETVFSYLDFRVVNSFSDLFTAASTIYDGDRPFLDTVFQAKKDVKVI